MLVRTDYVIPQREYNENRYELEKLIIVVFFVQTQNVFVDSLL